MNFLNYLPNELNLLICNKLGLIYRHNLITISYKYNIIFSDEIELYTILKQCYENRNTKFINIIVKYTNEQNKNVNFIKKYMNLLTLKEFNIIIPLLTRNKYYSLLQYLFNHYRDNNGKKLSIDIIRENFMYIFIWHHAKYEEYRKNIEFFLLYEDSDENSLTLEDMIKRNNNVIYNILISNGDIRLFKLLLEFRNKNGNPITLGCIRRCKNHMLNLAIEKGFIEIVKVLLNYTNSSGKKLTIKDLELNSLISNHRVAYDYKLFGTPLNDKLLMIKYIFGEYEDANGNKMSIDDIRQNNYYILNNAVYDKHYMELVQFLINYKDKNNNTLNINDVDNSQILSSASVNCKLDLVKYLLRYTDSVGNKLPVQSVLVAIDITTKYHKNAEFENRKRNYSTRELYIKYYSVINILNEYLNKNIVLNL